MEEALKDITLADIIGFALMIGVPLIRQIREYYRGKDWRWKCKAKTSSLNRYISFLISMILSGLVVYIMYIPIIFFFIIIFKIEMKEESIHFMFSIFSSVVYAILVWYVLQKDKNHKLEEMIFNKSYKFKKVIEFVLRYSVLLACGVMWSFIFSNYFIILFRTALGVILFCEILAIFVLESTKKYEYLYACFYLEDSKILDKINTENICKKGKWVVIKKTSKHKKKKDKDKFKEIRIRCKDIKRVAYYN